MNLHGRASSCRTCDGDRFVLVATHPSKNPLSPYEDYAPCPDCNHQDISYYRSNGTKFVPPDPARVRQMMRG